ncbi:TolC family outer membrane protein [Rhizobium sp. PAMB 3182]
MNSKLKAVLGAVLLVGTILSANGAGAMTLHEALALAVTTNPEVGQALENREAVEFELRQARGLYLPSVDLEASVGVRGFDSPSRRSIGLDDNALYPSGVDLVVTQKLFDGGKRRAGLDLQAARVDSASFRVLERSETIGLQVVREYLEYMLQTQIIAESKKNIAFHQGILKDIGSLISSGTLTVADRQQANERLLGAQARLQEATETLETVKASLNRLLGQQLTNPSMPKPVAGALPKSLDAAIDLARRGNPRISVANADIDAADANVRSARSNYLPEISAEGRLRTGNDIDGSDGHTGDAQVRLVARWNLYRGGIDIANEQEQIRRASEQRLALTQTHREVEEAVRVSWDSRMKQRELAGILSQQASSNAQLVSSYREQMSIGQRSLLDVLGAQNTRYNVDILSKTAQYAAIFADYRLLAATGSLLRTMQITPPNQAEAYARGSFKVRSVDNPQYNRRPSRQDPGIPMDLLLPSGN